MMKEDGKMTKKQLITVEQAAEIASMSIAWWRQALAGKKPMPPIRVIRIGKAVRLHLGDLLNWIEGGGQMSNMPSKGRNQKQKGVSKIK